MAGNERGSGSGYIISHLSDGRRIRLPLVSELTSPVFEGRPDFATPDPITKTNMELDAAKRRLEELRGEVNSLEGAIPRLEEKVKTLMDEQVVQDAVKAYRGEPSPRREVALHPTSLSTRADLTRLKNSAIDTAQSRPLVEQSPVTRGWGLKTRVAAGVLALVGAVGGGVVVYNTWFSGDRADAASASGAAGVANEVDTRRSAAMIGVCRDDEASAVAAQKLAESDMQVIFRAHGNAEVQLESLDGTPYGFSSEEGEDLSAIVKTTHEKPVEFLHGLCATATNEEVDEALKTGKLPINRESVRPTITIPGDPEERKVMALSVPVDGTDIKVPDEDMALWDEYRQQVSEKGLGYTEVAMAAGATHHATVTPEQADEILTTVAEAYIAGQPGITSFEITGEYPDSENQLLQLTVIGGDKPEVPGVIVGGSVEIPSMVPATGGE